MGDWAMTAGRSDGGMSSFLTREARWFRPGPLPVSVERWFAGDGLPAVASFRVDRYDVACAGRGVGIKDRGGATFDAKFRVTEERVMEIAPGLRGTVADWLKLTRPLEADDLPEIDGIATAAKRIVTRRYRATGALEFVPVFEYEAAVAGCDAEIVEVDVAGRTAWSLCFEAFGPSLERSFSGGIAAFLKDTPLPPGLAFDLPDSRGYPALVAEACVAARADHG